MDARLTKAGNQDKRNNGGEGGLKKRTPKQNGCIPPSPPPQGAWTVHESKLDKFAYTRVYLYEENHSRGRNAHTRLKYIHRYEFLIKTSVMRVSTGNGANSLFKAIFARHRTKFRPAENLTGHFVHSGPFNIVILFTRNFERLGV